MKLLYKKITSLCFILLSTSSFALEKCSNKLTVIEPASKAQVQDFIDWTKSHPKEIQEASYEPDDSDTFYLADINNDGKDEIIINNINAGGMGTMRSLILFIYAKQGSEYHYIGDAGNNPVDGDYWYTSSFFNILTKKPEMLVKLCNKIYFTFEKEVDGHAARAVNTWQDGEQQLVCNPEWANVHREYFKQLYAAKKYQHAFTYLKDTLASCSSVIDPKTQLWMKNDLALTAFKMGDPATCKHYIDEINTDNNFKLVTPALISSVKYNEQTCLTQLTNEIKHGNAGQYDYTWLTMNNPDWPLNYDRLLSAVIPSYSSSPNSLQDSIGPLYSDNDIDIKNKRYITIGLHGISNRPTEGMIWVDVQTSRSGIVAVVLDDNNSPNHFVVASRSMNKQELPKEFLEAVNQWINKYRDPYGSRIDSHKVEFYSYASEKSVDIAGMLKDVAKRKST